MQRKTVATAAFDRIRVSAEPVTCTGAGAAAPKDARATSSPTHRHPHQTGFRTMTRLILFCALAAFSIAPAMAGSFAGSSAGASSAGSSASSGSSSDDDKIVLQARDDAAGFVASNGAIRGVVLEAALRHLREDSAAARQASDMELAQAILAR
jgi:uncharacterized protein (TIGR02448 family)